MRYPILYFTVVLLLLSSCKKPENTIVFKDLSYGADTRNQLDIYLPQQRDTSTAMVLLIHGGAWVAGAKSNWSQEIIDLFLNSGYAVSCMSYRYACGDFHTQMEDIYNAIGFMRSKSEGWKIRNDKFSLMGASDGAHLS